MQGVCSAEHEVLREDDDKTERVSSVFFGAWAATCGEMCDVAAGVGTWIRQS